MIEGAKVYVTRFCLSSGKLGEGTINKDWGDNYVRLEGWYDSLKLGVDAFLDRADAAVDANKRVAKKIASVEKQIAKLRAMRFE